MMVIPLAKWSKRIPAAAKTAAYRRPLTDDPRSHRQEGHHAAGEQRQAETQANERPMKHQELSEASPRVVVHDEKST